MGFPEGWATELQKSPRAGTVTCDGTLGYSNHPGQPATWGYPRNPGGTQVNLVMRQCQSHDPEGGGDQRS